MNTWEAILPGLDAVACLCLGFLVFSRNTKHHANRLFLVTMIGAAAVEGIGSVSLTQGVAKAASWSFRTGLTILIATLISAVAFSAVLGRRNPHEILSRKRWLFLIQFFAGLVVTLQIWIKPVPVSFTAAGTSYFIFDPGSRLLLLYVAFSLILVIFHMEKLFRGTTGSRRWQVKFAVLGISASSFFYLLVVGTAIARLSLPADLLLANSIVFLATQFLMVFAVVRHRLLDVEIFISRDVTYRTFVTAIAVVYLFLVGIFGFWSRSLGGRFGLVLAASGVFILTVGGIVIFLSEHVRAGVRHYINTHFYRNKYEYRARWNSFTRQLGRIDDLPNLCRAILSEIEETMWVSKGSFWLVSEDKKSCRCVIADNTIKPREQLRVNSNFLRVMAEIGEPVSTEVLLHNEDIRKEHGELIGALSAVVCAPLMVRNEMAGFITLGPNLFEHSFEYEDREMLATLCSQAAVAIYQQFLSEQLATSRGLESLNRLSSLIIHDLKNAVSMLSMVIQNSAANMQKPEFQQDAVMTISRSVSKIKRLVERLSFPAREIIGPKYSEVDLNSLLDQVVERLQIDSLTKIRLSRDYGDIKLLYADQEMISHLFDNLILNAIQALSKEGGEIVIRTFPGDNGSVTAEINDNGFGIPPEMMANDLFKPFKTTKRKGLGIGLYHCRYIVDAHKGEIEVESRLGEGSTFRVKFPAIIANNRGHAMTIEQKQNIG